jgi:anti-sigma B factor antagonist
MFPEPTIEVRRPRPDVALVVLGGEHDLDSASDLEQTVNHSLAACDQLIIDLSAAEFIDSTTIAVLLRAKARAVQGDQRFSVVLGTEPAAERALEISGVLPLLSVVPTVEDALAP